MIVSSSAGTVSAAMNRVLLCLLVAVLMACGDDADDESRLPNGEVCSEDADCVSDHCLLDEVAGVQICAEPGGNNELEPGDTDDREGPSSSG